jgi:hypothetical protein
MYPACCFSLRPRQRVIDGVFKPDQILHVVSHDRVLHVVALPAADQYVAWCLEFPSVTVTAASRQQAIRQITAAVAAASDLDDEP